MPKYADNLKKALAQGTLGRDAIEHAIEEEPARTMLAS